LFFFSSRRRHTRSKRDWSSDVCSSDLETFFEEPDPRALHDLLGEKRFIALRVGIVAMIRDLRPRNSRDQARVEPTAAERRERGEIGRASCRERVEGWGVAGV